MIVLLLKIITKNLENEYVTVAFLWGQKEHGAMVVRGSY